MWEAKRPFSGLGVGTVEPTTLISDGSPGSTVEHEPTCLMLTPVLESKEPSMADREQMVARQGALAKSLKGQSAYRSGA